MKILIAFVIVYAIYNLQLYLYKKYWKTGLDVDLQFSRDIVLLGEKVELVEVIKNNKPLALPILNVKFATSRSFTFDEEDNANVSDMYYRNDIFSILGNRKIERRLEFTTTQRGVYRIKELQVSTKDLFLKSHFADMMENDTEIIVCPQTVMINDYIKVWDRLMGDYEVNRWDNPDPFAFRGIRDYQPYDSMRNINWKATARTGDIMVNQFSPTTESEVRIYLNLKPYSKSLADTLAEFAISIVAGIAKAYTARGISISFYTNGFDIDSELENVEENEKISYCPVLDAGCGKGHLRALNILLARLDVSKKTSDMISILEEGFKASESNVTHVIVSTYRDDALYDFYKKHLQNDVVYWIVPERYGNHVDLRYDGMFRMDI